MFGSQPIDEKIEGVAMSKSGKRGRQLNIENVRAEHAGDYSCVASNIAGSTSRSAILDVNGIFFFSNTVTSIIFVD